MKKNNFIYALLGAIALAGAGGLSSCTSEDEVVDVNPGYNQETGEVPVQFVFNVATGNTPVTRMSQADVQATASDVFRGMAESYLMSYKLTNDGSFETVAATADKLYGLGPILGNGNIGPDSETKSHRVLELSLPTGTNSVMFWARAARATADTDSKVGKVDFNVDQNISNCSFKLCPRVPEGTETTKYNRTTFKNYQDLIIYILNKIVQTELDNPTASFPEGSDNSKTIPGKLRWADYGIKEIKDNNNTVTGYELEKKGTQTHKDPTGAEPDDATKDELCGLGEILSNAFYTLNKIYSTTTTQELRAGSGTAVLKMLSDLFVVVNTVANANPTNVREEFAKKIGVAIKTNLTKVLNDTGTDWLSITTMTDAQHLNKSILIPSDNNNLSKFPAVFGMPDGSTILNYELAEGSTFKNEYSYRATIPTYNITATASQEFDIFNYMYPAELCYFGNSPIRVTNATVLAKDFPEGTTDWDKDASWTGWDVSHVVSSTRSVAMKDNINYGTSLLKSKVIYDSSISELEDNKEVIQKRFDPTSTEENNKITIDDGLFTLKGIIVGGQEQEMGWNYVAKATSPTFKYMIYDNSLSSTQQSIKTTGSDYAYTLVWDNWNQALSGGKQNVVYIALEFVNNSGIDFWGENNLIRQGGTFYIAGKLDPDEGLSTDDRSAGVTWPENYALPPYDTSGNTIKKERRVFIQDFMTTANFVLGKTSLQHAMVEVPDLRSAQLSLGLSVDLEWSSGLSFTNVMLGGDDDDTSSSSGSGGGGGGN